MRLLSIFSQIRAKREGFGVRTAQTQKLNPTLEVLREGGGHFF